MLRRDFSISINLSFRDWLHFRDQIKRLRILSLKFIKLGVSEVCDAGGGDANCAAELDNSIVMPVLGSPILQPKPDRANVRGDVLTAGFVGDLSVDHEDLLAVERVSHGALVEHLLHAVVALGPTDAQP